MAIMIASIHISQEIFVIDMLTALKSSLEHDQKHGNKQTIFKKRKQTILKNCFVTNHSNGKFFGIATVSLESKLYREIFFFFDCYGFLQTQKRLSYFKVEGSFLT